MSISRWLLFRHKDVSSAAIFFSVSVFNLSGAINVLLFLIVRPELLLFTPPHKITDPSTSSAILAERANYHHSPQPTEKKLADDGGQNPPHDPNEVALSHIEPRPRLEGLEGI